MGNNAESWIALILCAAMILGWSVEHLVRNQPDYAEAFAPDWLPIVAAGLTAAGIVRLNGLPQWLRVQRVLQWSGLLLMVWVANGLPIDLLRIAGLIPLEVDWPGLVTRTLALAAAVVLAHLALARPVAATSTREAKSAHAASWYGYAAFVLALVYPFFRTVWVFGGTLGLMMPGAAGQGFEPWLACTPWLLAAVLSLLLVPKHSWMPRRLLLVAGWSATAIVAMVGPAGSWSLINAAINGVDAGLGDIEGWIPYVFYGSWFLWAIAAGAATRSYQLRSEGLQNVFADRTISMEVK